MSPEIYLVADDLPGSLFIMPCPSGDYLIQDISAYGALGVNTLVSMLAAQEAAELGLGREDAACVNAGIDFLSSPIADFGLPDIDIFDALVRQIAATLSDGRKVAVHCRAGIGRSGMVTAGTLIALGWDAGKAVKQITKARGVPIPDTVEQGKFIIKYERRRHSEKD